ncbi:SulP family inorganic anion transporter [Cyanobium sp. LEGE 06143]|nr:SulP family inorganic anion transporter [Cyanobium sp. LEGE 06143]
MPSLLQGVLPLPPAQWRTDAMAGVTLAALAIPEVMGYTRISQTPVVTGLYTLLMPMLAFALLGSSRHLVVAADSATAAILAATLAGVAKPESSSYSELTMAVALVVGGMLLLASVLRLGFLADFLSRSALIGLLTGIGVQVAAGEFGGLFGLEPVKAGAVQQILSVLFRLGESRALHLLVAIAVLTIIAGCRALNPRLPGALIAVISSVLASWLLHFQALGIPVVGTVPRGLPQFTLPSIQPAEWNQVLITSASCFVVILAQSAATSRAYAQRYGERCSENVDLFGLACANAAAGLSGTFVVNGSPTKTEMVDAAGGRSQVANLSTAAMVLLVLLFLTGPLSLMPAVVLSSIVFLIGLKLIDLDGMRELWTLQRNEFFIALATVISVAQLGVMQGIVLAVLLSLIEQVRHTYRPRTRLWRPHPSGKGWQSVPVRPGVFVAPGIVAYRFEANLFYANANHFTDELLKLVSSQRQPVTAVVIDASGIDDVDYSAGKALIELQQQLGGRGIRSAFLTTSTALMRELQRFGLASGPTDGGPFPSLKKAIQALVTKSTSEA